MSDSAPALRLVRTFCRLLYGQEPENDAPNYREAQEASASQVPESFDARTRGYLLLKHHGQEICKRTEPKCEECRVSTNCAFFASHLRHMATNDA